ncbi:DNA topoisomerase [Rubricoccus marinus]|uniref:DNA topoisomerase (ATP-hydrolyzing) n=2 Tax=Rubricoccus marinus TaxID=716817 RepID=A0A259U0C6_9BACT|nr:DNA topoisomerase [Rubricoccus marinus]
MPVVDVIPLHETARERYLNYALSVITSRALPDVRDGLKPVQRRILYAMATNLRLTPEARFRKSATIVGEVMGKYHPHGDSAIYDAMVRMAQSFALRAPLVDGQGNFGSLDGDPPAAMRYTEARLQALGADMTAEIKYDTVAFRPTYDGTLFEPVVLPAPVPNLLINGATGIAVGMATNIPPHNLAEIVDAAVTLIKSPNARLETLLNHVKGPDFPTGGRILNTPAEIAKIYETGEGTIDVRGEYETEGKAKVIITSIPYAMTKSSLIEKIADHIRLGKVPQIVDIRDESTDEVRIVLEIKRGASADAAMAYLFKHTPLQSRFHVNLTCLVPTDNPEISAPEKLDLKTALQHFLDFRLDVVTRRLKHELRQLEKRIHILKGFVVVFDALDEAIKLIRASKNKADASQRLRHRFGIDELQADAVLEIKLYRLARMEINAIRKELAEKEARAAEIRALLADESGRWRMVRKELLAAKKKYADARRSTIAGPDAVIEYSAEDYIIAEDVYVIVTREGWVKRQRSYTALDAIRVREGDTVMHALGASTRASIGFFTSAGRCYTARVDDLPQTTGYGDPIQKYFDFKDKERVIGVVSFDERVLPRGVPELDGEAAPELFQGDGAPPEDAFVGPYVVAVSTDGLAVRVETGAFEDPSNKNGRVFMRVRKGESVVGAELASGDENVCLASKQGRALIFPVRQVPVFKSAAKGVIAMRLAAKDDRILGVAVSDAARRGLEVETSRGRPETVRTTKFEVSNRGNKGSTIISKGTLRTAEPDPIELHLPGKE